MKEFTAICILLCMSIVLFSCSKQVGKTVPTTESDVAIMGVTAEQAMTKDYFEKETTSKQMVFFEESTVILDNGTYRFEIPKTKFEDAYSEELLLQIANMLSMKFGVEDYYDWNTSGQNIFSDVRINNLVISGCYKNFEFLDEHIDKEAYSMFLMDVGLDNLRGCEVVTFSLANYNDYLKDFFGPDVKQLTIDNFETGKTALEKGLAVDGDLSEGDSRCFYTGKDDIMLVQVCATGYSCFGEYIYNVEKEGNDYWVYTVGEIETEGLIQSYDEFQVQMINDIPHTINRGMLPARKYKFGCTSDGDVYLKSVDRSFLIAENAKCDFIVTQNAEVKNKKANSEEYRVIGTIPKGTKVLRIPFYANRETSQKGMCFVVSKAYSGFVAEEYLKALERE